MYQTPRGLISSTKLILLPVDGSRDSSRAASVAFELSYMTGAKLLIIHVINVGAVQQVAKMSGTDPAVVLNRYMENGHNLLEQYRGAAQSMD